MSRRPAAPTAEALARQQALADAMPAHVALVDGAGVIVAVNAPWRRFAQENGWHDPDAGIGSDYLAVCRVAQGADAVSARAVADGLRDVLAGVRDDATFEYPCDSPTAARWFRLRITPWREGGGAVLAHVEITERVEAVAAAEHRLRALLAGAHEGLLISEIDGTVRYASPGVLTVLGVGPEGVVGHDGAEVHPDDAGALAEIRAALLRDPERPATATFRVPAGDQWRWVEVTCRNALADPAIGGFVTSVRDVTARRVAETALRERAEFEALVAAISTRFVTCPFDEVEAAIADALRRVGTFVAVDRVFVMVNRREGVRGHLSEWNAAGIPPLLTGPEALPPLADCVWSFNQLLRGETVHIAHLAALPPEAAAERAYLEAHGVRSSVLVPIRQGDTLLGVVGYATLRVSKAWSAESLARLRVVGDMIFGALERRRAEAELRARAARQEALVALGRHALGAGHLDAVLERAALVAAQVLGAELSVIVEQLDDGETLRSRAGVGWRLGLVGHTAVGDGAQSHVGYTLAAGAPVVIDTLATETRFHATPVLRSHGVVSGAAVPIRGEGRPFGALAVYTRAHRAFGVGELQFLEAVAQTLAAACEREHAERLAGYLASIVSSTDDAIVGQTLDGIIVSWNPAAERLYGYPAAEAVGRSVGLIVPAERRAELDELLARVRRGERVDRLETVRVARDGTPREVSLTLSPICDATGRTMGASVIARDLSAVRRTAQALARSSERLRALREIDSAILAAASPEAIAQAAVTRLRHLVGCARVSVAIATEEQDGSVVLAADGVSSAAIAAGQVHRRGILGDLEPLRRGETQLVEDFAALATPPRFIANLAAVGLRSLARVPLLLDGQLMGSLNLAAETTHAFDAEHLELARAVADRLAVALRQARLHAQVQRHAAELEQHVQARTEELHTAMRELEAFSYSVSHDLRAPLRSLDGFSRALLEDCSDRLDATGRSHLARIVAAAKRMAELIDGLLELSRVSRVALRRRTTDLSSLARAVVAECRLANPGRQVEVDIADAMQVDADPVLLRAALQNLVDNAWKYTARHPTARVEIGRRAGADGETVYFVRDDGAGFDMTYADKLFSPFQRLHAAGEFEGTGIGLATVQRIIQRHGGRVWAEGAVDRGATIFFTLPPPTPMGTTARRATG